MTLDLTAVRRDTLGCEQVAHFNNAGGSLPPRAVNAAVIDHLRQEELRGAYESAEAAAPRVEQVYTSTAKLIGAGVGEIALVESATRAWDIAFYGFRLQAGDRVLVDRARYPSYAVSMIQVARRSGAVIELVDNDGSGQLDLADLERRLQTGPRLVALTHIPTDSGLINPIVQAGELCRSTGVPLLVDACQSVGQLALDVNDLGCDMLTGTGRKFLRGPRGTGFLYVRTEWLEAIEPLTLDTSSAVWTTPTSYRLLPTARRYESFERSIATVLGLGAAVDYALGLGAVDIETRVFAVADLLRQRLAEVGSVRLDRYGARQCGIVTFTVDGMHSDAVQRALSAKAINTSVTRQHAGAQEPGSTPVQARIRASVHYFNTEAEIDALVSAIEQMSVGR